MEKSNQTPLHLDMSLFVLCVPCFSLGGPSSFSVTLQNPKIGICLGKTSICKIDTVKIESQSGLG